MFNTTENATSFATNNHIQQIPHIGVVCDDAELKKYVEETYGADCWTESQNAEDKSIPIYDFSLDNCEYITVNDPDALVRILKKYGITGVTFNSSTMEKCNDGFDSFSVQKLISKTNNPKIFEELVDIIDHKVFMKKGRITRADGVGNDFLCSIPLNTQRVDPEAKINYFPLKNLKNPEDRHDYDISWTNNESNVNPAYDLHDSCDAAEVFDFADKVVKPLQDFITSWTIDPTLTELVEIASKQNPYITSRCYCKQVFQFDGSNVR